MKYLKSYEKIITKHDINKKYIILKEFGKEYYLLKVSDVNFHVAIHCEKIYHYKDELYKYNEEDVRRENHIYYITKTDMSREIVYQNDNLEKTLEHLNILVDQNKYNL